MIQATINNTIIETFLYERFDGDQRKITEYINDFLHKYLPQSEENIAFEEDKQRFHETYQRMQNGTEPMFLEEEANRRTEAFLKTL